MQIGALVRLLVVLSLVLLLPGIAGVGTAEAATTLRQGARGQEVVQLQQRLTELRYDVGKVDGVFGQTTRHAVVAFQKANGLARDGIVGPRTRAALAKPVAVAPSRVQTGRYVEVDITRQILILARDGEVERIFEVSTGKASTPTPMGRFTIERRIDGWRTSRLGTLWRPAYFKGGYAVHGYSSIPSHPASSGCVRIPNASMNRLWSAIPVGTPVEIRGDGLTATSCGSSGIR
jgi:peptidoglycan hydrolase-like protein with peptidoglycan-binding domain